MHRLEVCIPIRFPEILVAKRDFNRDLTTIYSTFNGNVMTNHNSIQIFSPAKFLKKTSRTFIETLKTLANEMNKETEEC